MKHLLSVVFFSLLLSQNPASAQKAAGTIVVQNYYWAKEGKIQEVYEHRLYASEVRKKLGLKEGRVLKRIGTDGERSHVIWECEYASEEAREEDVRKLTESGAFEEVTKKMRTLLDKFDRGVYLIKN